MLTSILGTKNLKVVPSLFAYLFHRIDQRQFLDYIEDKGFVEDRTEALRIKDCARTNGYVLKNCKLYAWACWSARELGRALPSASSFEVDAEDAKILRRLNLKHLNRRNGFTRYSAYSLQSFDRMTANLIASRELKNYIGKFVTKKMSFLMKSYGETRHDLETSLQEAALIALYKQYPRFDNEIHMINVAKAQIHNAGHTMITTLTSKSRQRLSQNADGSFEAVNVDVATLADVAAPPQYGAMLKDRLQALAAVEHKLSPRAKDFLMCAAGQYHEGFSKWLQVNNDDAADEWPYQRYMREAQKYFDVSAEKVERLYASIRNYAHQTNLT